MAKGYIIARVTVEDAERYAEYAKGSGAAMQKYGARVLVRGGRYEALCRPTSAYERRKLE